MHPMTRAEMEGSGGTESFVGQLLAGKAPKAGPVASSRFDLRQLFTTGFPAARDQTDSTMFLDGYAALVSQRAGD